MCGILGEISTSEQLSNSSLFESCLSLLSHRGPDNTGIYRSNQVQLGHCRLAIIDLEERSNQPFSKYDEYILVFNGEIYNYQELRSSLPEVEFKTESDTEVLYELLIKKGVEGIKLLNGFYAFAFINYKSNEVILARDKMGIKPLYCCKGTSQLIFSSELRPIIKCKGSFTLNPNALNELLMYSFIPAPNTIDVDVEKLLPGEVRTYSLSSLKKDASFNGITPVPSKGETLKEELEKSVKRRLVADRELGCFLSGGIDSSIIASLAIKDKPTLRTYSVGFENALLDESQDAEVVARHIGSNHTTIKLAEEELISNLDSFLKKLDEPFADSSALAVYTLSKVVRQDIVVALSGDGADELFAGYNRHFALHRKLHGHPTIGIANLIGKFAGAGSEGRESRVKNLLRKSKKLGALKGLSLNEAYGFLSCFVQPAEVTKFTLITPQPYQPYGTLTSIQDILREDQQLILPNDMLKKVDLASMAHALEVRTPFLDENVVAIARGLCEEQLTNGRKGKLILRELFKEDLPEQVFNKPKHGFEVPIRTWIQTSLLNRINSYFNNRKLVEFAGLDYQRIQQIDIKKCHTGTSNPETLIWTIFVLLNWIDSLDNA